MDEELVCWLSGGRSGSGGSSPGKRCGHLGGGSGGCQPANAWPAGRFGAMRQAGTSQGAGLHQSGCPQLWQFSRPWWWLSHPTHLCLRQLSNPCDLSAAQQPPVASPAGSTATCTCFCVACGRSCGLLARPGRSCGVQAAPCLNSCCSFLAALNCLCGCPYSCLTSLPIRACCLLGHACHCRCLNHGSLELVGGVVKVGWLAHCRDLEDSGLHWPYIPPHLPLPTYLFFKEIEIHQPCSGLDPPPAK